MISKNSYKVLNSYKFLKIGGFFIIISLMLYVSITIPPFFEHTMFNISFLILSFLIVALFITNYQLTNPTTYLLCFYTLYYLFMPLFYIRGTVWHYFGKEFIGNWNLAAKGNMGAILGLLGYSIGLFSSKIFISKNKSRFVSSSEILTKEWASLLYKVYFLVGLSGWVTIFLITDMPFEVFMGVPADRRGIQPGGGGYLYTIIFGFNIALLLYIIANKKKKLLSLPTILLVGTCIFFSMIRGSRLYIAALPLSIYFLYTLLNLTLYKKVYFSKIIFKKLCFITFLALLLLFSFFYASHRSSRSFAWSWNNISRYISTIADSSGYLMVIKYVPKNVDYWYGRSYMHPFIVYIPHIFFPSKWDYLYSQTKYTAIFYHGSNPFAASSSETIRGYTLLGEIYINFGWYGFIPIMFLLGFLNNSLYLKAHLPDTSALYKVVFALYISVVSFGIVKMGSVGALEGFFQNVLCFFLFPFLFFYKLKIKMGKGLRRLRKPIISRVRIG